MPLRHTLAAVLLAAAAPLGLAVTASPVAAQSYGFDNDYNDDSGYAAPAPGTEEVIVTAPRYRAPARGHLGGDIVNVRMSREVRVDDLDLDSYEGRHELLTRVRSTAQRLCDRLDRFYPVGVEDSGYTGAYGTGTRGCVRQAVARAMDQADVAIRDARY